MNVDTIIEIVKTLGVIATAITTILFLIGKINELQAEKIKGLVSKIVYAMEMIFPESGQGTVKFENADKILAEQTKLDEGERKLLIEEAVETMNIAKGVV